MKRRAERLGMDGNLCTHSFRATVITTYLEAGGHFSRRPRWRGMPFVIRLRTDVA
ncbi:MAG: hypothetical protein AAF627_11890 [Myxococcota bacterium]